MIDGMLLAGFKGFPYEYDYLRLRPITLIFGANGAGKSSLLQAIAWLHHLHNGGSADTHRLRLTGDHVNLGGINRFKSRTDPLAPYAGLTTDDAIGAGWGFRMQDPIRSPDDFQERHSFWGLDLPSWRLTYEVSARGIEMVRIYCGPLPILWERDGDTFRHTGFWPPLDPTDAHQVEGCLDDFSRMDPEDLFACIHSLFGVEIEQQPEAAAWAKTFSDWVRDRLRASDFRLEGIAPILRLGDRDGQAPAWAQEFLSNLDAAIAQMGRDISTFLDGLDYLGPWRRIPTASDLAVTWGEAAPREFMLWNRLQDDDDLRTALNGWLEKLGSNLQVALRDLVSRDRLLLELNEAGITPETVGQFLPIKEDAHAVRVKLVDTILSIIGFLPSEEKGIILQLAPSKEQIAPTETGIGFSQVVPLIIAALSGTPRNWIVEQPELHLHPQAQAQLGDLLIQGSCATTGPRHWFIVETHSEHLILRLLRRVRETKQRFGSNPFPLRPEEIGVAHVGRQLSSDGVSLEVQMSKTDPKNNSNDDSSSDIDDWTRKALVKQSKITNIPVTESGDFAIKWPGGFFEERLDELFSDDERNSWMRS